VSADVDPRASTLRIICEFVKIDICNPHSDPLLLFEAQPAGPVPEFWIDSRPAKAKMSESSDSEGAASDASTPRLEEPTEEAKAQSEELKSRANTKFQENHFVDAVDLYTKALELNPKNHILFANRAFSNIKLENYGQHSYCHLGS
jgi:hypothetical protein